MKNPLVLIGQSGVGKSSVGEALAKQLGASYRDLDDSITESTGETPSEIISNKGEDEFRKVESDELEAVLLADYQVVACGGGAVLSDRNKQLLGNTHVVLLTCSVATLCERLQRSYERPLLGSDEELEVRVAEQRSDRMKHYLLCADSIIDTTVLDVDEVVARVIEMSRRNADDGDQVSSVYQVEVSTTTPYTVYVGAGELERLSSIVEAEGGKAALITQQGVEVEVKTGLDELVLTLPDGEQAKSMATVEHLCSQLAAGEFTRKDVVVGIGGGVTTDLAGFVAATYHRGTDVIHVPTSLLAQVDAAIGGKCGVNLPEGKNLVGAFWQPKAVVCDPNVLKTLPPKEFRNGLAEIAKYRLLAPTLKRLGIRFLGDEDQFSEMNLTQLIATSVSIKAEVVAADERESGLRAILNYGHTLAHGIETASGYTVAHGTAVAVGLAYAGELAHSLGRIDGERLSEHYRVLSDYGLTATLDSSYDHDQLIGLFKSDKKATGQITFVLDGPSGIEPVVVEDRSVLAGCLDKVQRLTV